MDWKRFAISVLLIVATFSWPFFVRDNFVDVTTSIQRVVAEPAINGNDTFVQVIRLDANTLARSTRVCIAPMILVPPKGGDGSILIQLSSGGTTLAERRIKGDVQKRNGFVQLCADKQPAKDVLLKIRDLNPDTKQPLSVRLSRDTSFGRLDNNKSAALQLRIRYSVTPFQLFQSTGALAAVVAAVLGFALFISLAFFSQFRRA